MERLSWLRKKLIKWLLNIDVERALRARLHDGIEIGKKQSATVYAQNCEHCQVPLQQVRPGVFVCPFCVLQERFTGPVLPVVERQTGAMRLEAPGQTFRTFVREAHNTPTAFHKAIQKATSPVREHSYS